MFQGKINCWKKTIWENLYPYAKIDLLKLEIAEVKSWRIKY